MFTGLAICFPVLLLVLLFVTETGIYLLIYLSIGPGFNVLGFCKFIMNWDLGNSRNYVGSNCYWI